jgi:hypothetical protein
MRQFPRGSFLRIEGFFLRMPVNLKIFSENLGLFYSDLRFFLEISILFEDISREILAFFLINRRDFQRLRGFWNTYLEELRLFKVM